MAMQWSSTSSKNNKSRQTYSSVDRRKKSDKNAKGRLKRIWPNSRLRKKSKTPKRLKSAKKRKNEKKSTRKGWENVARSSERIESKKSLWRSRSKKLRMPRISNCKPKKDVNKSSSASVRNVNSSKSNRRSWTTNSRPCQTNVRRIRWTSSRKRPLRRKRKSNLNLKSTNRPNKAITNAF